MSSHPHGMRFSPFSSGSKNIILSAQQQPQQQTPIQQSANVVTMRQPRKSATPTNIPVPTPKVVIREKKNVHETKNTGFSDTEDDEQDYFDDESDANLSREERYVLLQPRAEPQGQENLSGNVTPVNDTQQLNIYEKIPSTPPIKMRYSSVSNDSTNQQMRYSNTSSNRSVSADLRNHPDNNGSQRNSLILQQHSNRNSMDHPQSNRSSMDVSQSSYNTLIIHDSNETQPLFSASANQSGLIKHELYFINSSPSPPNYGVKKDKSASRSFGNYNSHVLGNDGNMMAPITENEQQYLNQSYVLKHLAKEVKMPNAMAPVDSTRDSGVSENNCSTSGGKNKSKSQPDLTKLAGSESLEISNNSASNTLNFNDFEQLEVENIKLREQLLKVAKSQKLEQEVTNIYRVHEELVQSCERRERLERTARTRLQSDCRRLQEVNRTLREQVEILQQQLSNAAMSQQQQLSSTGRTQQDLLINQLIQQNKELVDANKRQYIEIQAQSATLEEQRIHINVLDSALKRLEEEVRQKQIYQKQLQSLLGANERRDKLRNELENELSKDLSHTPTTEANLKWQLREKDNQIMRLESERSTMDDPRKMNSQQSGQDNDRIISEAHLAQRKVNELQTRLKLVENRLAEKEKEDIIRQLQEQKLYAGSVGNSYGIITNNNCYNTPSSSSIVSSAPTTPLIFNAANYDNLMPSTSSSKTTSATSNASFDALLAGAYSGLYQSNYGQKLSSVPPNSSGISPNASCSSSSTIQQHQHQQPSTTSSNTSNYLNYDQSLDEQRKSIDDQLKKLDNQLLNKVGELTLIQQHHIQLQQQQNRNLKTKNVALMHNSRASSLSLCNNSVSGINRASINKSVDVTNNLKAQNNLSNSMQSLSMVYDNRISDEEDQEIFY